MKPGRPRRAGLLVAMLAISLGWSALLVEHQLAGNLPLIDRVDAAFSDVCFRLWGPGPAPAGTSIVALDDETAAEFGYPLPRAQLALLVERLADAGAAAIGIDLLLVEAKDPDGDRRLAAAITRVPVVLAAAARFPLAADRTGDGRLPVAGDLLLPVAPFSQAGGIGLVNLGTAPGGAVTGVPLLVEYSGRLLPSFPLRLAAAGAGVEPELLTDGIRLDGRRIRLDIGEVLPLRFFGPRGSVLTVGASKLIGDPRLAEPLRGQIVLIGSTVFGSGDTFATPFDPALPGVEVLATAASHLRAGGALVRTGRMRQLEAAVATVLPLLGLLPALSRSAAWGIAAALAGMATWLLVAFVSFGWGLLLSVGGPLAPAVSMLPLWIAGRFWLDQTAQRQLERQRSGLSAFHAPALAQRLNQDPDFLLKPVERVCAVLFIDLSGFTSLSERIGPGRTRDLVQDFLSRVAAIVGQHDGVVLGFLGDGAMAVFGALDATPGMAAVHALDAARRLAADVAAWIAGQDAETVRGVRIGATYGPVILSRVGSESHVHITALGDTVNVASRLLDAAKAEGAEIAVGTDLVEAALPYDPAVAARAGLGPSRPVDLRGRRHRVDVRFGPAADPARRSPPGLEATTDRGGATPPCR